MTSAFRTPKTVCLFLLAFVTVVSCRDVMVSSQGLRKLGSRCTEMYLPTMQLCPECNIRKTYLTVEPHNAVPSQNITVQRFDASIIDTVVLVDNTGFAQITAVQTSNGYAVCTQSDTEISGFSISMSVLLQRLAAPLPGPPALPITQTWTLPDRDAAYVQIDGVVTDTTACVHAGSAMSSTECMHLCTVMEACSYLVVRAGVCDLCLQAIQPSFVWTLQTTTVNSVFIRGKSVHIFINDPVHAVSLFTYAFPDEQKTMTSVFIIFATLLTASAVYLAVVGDVADTAMAFDQLCQLRKKDVLQVPQEETPAEPQPSSTLPPPNGPPVVPVHVPSEGDLPSALPQKITLSTAVLSLPEALI